MAKRIVICADGTWNKPDQKDGNKVCPSNVAKLALSVPSLDSGGMPQLMYYETGVGTGWCDRLRGGAFGMGITQKIQAAYRFLVENHEEGDEIFLFGFSRGAYTVRSLAGLVRNSGLLRRKYEQMLPEAYALYRRRDEWSQPNEIEATLFRQTYSKEVRIKCIGVWDTVGALGIPLGPQHPINWAVDALWGYRFHDVKLSSYVDNAFQALAIDERRGPFQPAIWEQQEHAKNQVLEQIWFAGVHSNIGGGYEDSGLSDIAFLWLREKAQGCGLAFDDALLQQAGIAVNPRWDGVLRDSMTWLYRLSPACGRPIGAAKAGNESVHSTAMMRYQQDGAYRPENLSRYLKEPGAARG